MSTNKKTTIILEDVKVNVKIKLSALWVTLMFIYLYVDHFSLFKPAVIEEIMAGRVWEFDITQTWAMGAMIMMTIPALMVFLSLILKAKAARWTNIIVGFLSIVIVIVNVLGESWAFYIFGSVVEFVLLSLTIGFAWRWPRQEA